MPRERMSVVILLGILALTGVVGVWRLGRSSAGIDFYQMWVGPRIARQTTAFYEPATRAAMGQEYVRRAETEESSPRRLAVARHRQNLELLSTPMLYTLFAPLAGSYERDLLLFQLAMI